MPRRAQHDPARRARAGGGPLTQERLEIEFGAYSRWLADVIADLGLPDPVPPACRGTADPELFARMAAAVGARPGMTVLDVGCGIGGPAAWLEREHDCAVVGLDIMEASARGVTRLFPAIRTVVGDSARLPFRDETFEAAWGLGVLETIVDKVATLEEIARVLAPGGRAALHSLVAVGPLDVVPLADHFVTPRQMLADVAASGLVIESAGPLPSPPAAPPRWRAWVVKARDEVERRHGHDPAFEPVRDELDKIATLCASDQLQAWEFTLVR